MDITRRRFLQGLGVFSFSVAIGIPSLSATPLLPHSMYGIRMRVGSDRKDNRIKAAYLGVGDIGMSAGNDLSQFMGLRLRKFPGAEQDHLLLRLLRRPTIRDVESYLQDKDIVAVVGSMDDPEMEHARDLALDKAQFAWTIAVCPPAPEDAESRIIPKQKDVVRLFRHSRYPLDHPEIFTRMVHDIWLYHNAPPQWNELCEVCGDLGIYHGP
jgi:hypothetical protein